MLLTVKVDLLVCNPPYVSTEEAELGGTGISAAWAGGQAGLTITRYQGTSGTIPPVCRYLYCLSKKS